MSFSKSMSSTSIKKEIVVTDVRTYAEESLTTEEIRHQGLSLKMFQVEQDFKEGLLVARKT